MRNQVRLNCGVNLPIIGLGTFSYQIDTKAIESAVHMAIDVQTYALVLQFLSCFSFYSQFLIVFMENFFEFSDGL